MEPVRYSNLRALAKSPAHYRALLETPRTDTPAMRLGRLVHTLVLGGAAPVVYEGERRGKAWAEFRDAAGCAEIVTAEEMRKAREVAASVLDDANAAPLLRGVDVVAEERLLWTMDGTPCAGTPDAVGAKHIADLKTTADADPRAFMRHAERMHYHAQLAWYRNAVDLSVEVRPLDCYLVAVETEPPYAVTTIHLSDAVIEKGDALWRGWWERLLSCTGSGIWPGYATDPVEWELNEWEENFMSDIELEGKPATVNAADKYRQLQAEMQALGDSLRAERLELLERLRHVDAVLADIAPAKARRVRKALGTVAEPKPRRSRKAEVAA